MILRPKDEYDRVMPNDLAVYGTVPRIMEMDGGAYFSYFLQEPLNDTTEANTSRLLWTDIP